MSVRPWWMLGCGATLAAGGGAVVLVIVRSLLSILRAHDLAQPVDRAALVGAAVEVVPVFPAVARCALDGSANLVDRAAELPMPNLAVREHHCGDVVAVAEVQLLARLEQPALQQRAEGHARPIALALEDEDAVERRGLDAVDARLGDLDVALVALDADPAAMQLLGDRASGAAAEKRVEHDIARVGCRQDRAVQQRLGLLGGVCLFAIDLDALGAGAERQLPVAAHLDAVVERLHSL